MSAPRTYLDCNASEILRPEARAAMVAALDLAGNPSSVHGEGRRVRAVIEEARGSVAALVNAKPSEIVFTSGATEANAAALAGFDRVIACGIEHDSILAPARGPDPAASRLRSFGASREGVADLAELAALASEAAVADGRTLVTLQMANNETGVIEPVVEAIQIARDNGLAFHTDAVQAAGRIAVDFAALGADTMSLSGHKIGGPKGVGALVIRDGVHLLPLFVGGGQERRRRGGTENAAAIAGFGAAALAAKRDLPGRARIRDLRDAMEREIVALTPSAVVIGASVPRLDNTTCVALPGLRAETLVIKLDLAGLAVSAGAACSSGKVGPSHVLSAMGLPPEIASAAIRVSLGHATTEADVAAFLGAWKACAPATALAA